MCNRDRDWERERKKPTHTHTQLLIWKKFDIYRLDNQVVAVVVVKLRSDTINMKEYIIAILNISNCYNVYLFFISFSLVSF